MEHLGQCLSNISQALTGFQVNPGDVVYISDGTESTVYYEMLTPQCQGTITNQIIIIAGKYAPNNVGHSGRVIIDGGGQARDNSILFDDYAGGSLLI